MKDSFLCDHSASPTMHRCCPHQTTIPSPKSNPSSAFYTAKGLSPINLSSAFPPQHEQYPPRSGTFLPTPPYHGAMYQPTVDWQILGRTLREKATLRRLKNLFALKSKKIKDPVKEAAWILNQNGIIFSTIETLFEVNGSYKWIKYRDWDSKHKNFLLTKIRALSDLWSIILNSESIPYSKISSSLNMNPDSQTFSLQEVTDFYMTHIAHCLLVEIYELVPWRLNHFSLNTLRFLLSGKYIYANYDLTNT